MVTRKWLVETENPNTVRVNHWRAWSGKFHIYVDDELIYERRSSLYDKGLEHCFKVDGLPYLLRTIYRTWYFSYELWIDGKLQ